MTHTNGKNISLQTYFRIAEKKAFNGLRELIFKSLLSLILKE